MPEFGKTILGKDIAPFDEKSYEIVPAGLIVGLGLSGPWNIHLFFTLPHKLHVKDDTFSMTGLVSSLPPVIPLRTACADCIMHLTGLHHHPSRHSVATRSRTETSRSPTSIRLGLPRQAVVTAALVSLSTPSL
jgi:hypothetical protein